jgi:hypothetical protein
MRSNSLKVSSNIRLFAILLSSLLGAYSASTLAQSPNEDVFVQTTNEQEKIIQEAISQSASNTNSQQPVLRLEDTIRGNKEQPQVLTIVPWQLPVHQRINENTEWQLQVTQLPSIERNAFLRNLAVVNEIKVTQASRSPASETIQDE